MLLIEHMKRIEAIIRTDIVPDLKLRLEKFEIYGLSISSITSAHISSRNGAVGRGGGIGEFLSKLELIVSDRDAKKVIDVINSTAREKGKEYAKIFVSTLEEIVDESHSIKDLEDVTDYNDRPDISISADESADDNEQEEKRSRLVPLQKYTLMRVSKFYSINKDTLKSEYRIKSFSDFVNFCILGYLPIIESELKQQTIEGRSKLLRA